MVAAYEAEKCLQQVAAFNDGSMAPQLVLGWFFCGQEISLKLAKASASESQVPRGRCKIIGHLAFYNSGINKFEIESLSRCGNKVAKWNNKHLGMYLSLCAAFYSLWPSFVARFMAIIWAFDFPSFWCPSRWPQVEILARSIQLIRSFDGVTLFCFMVTIFGRLTVENWKLNDCRRVCEGLEKREYWIYINANIKEGYINMCSREILENALNL